MQDPDFKQKRFIFFTFLGVVFLFGVYQFFRDKEIKEVGIFTKCTVINSEASKGGIIITVQYFYKGGSYEYSLGSDLGKKAIGRQYFVQLKPEDPSTIVFRRDKPVPECLSNNVAPFGGWKQIPACP